MTKKKAHKPGSATIALNKRARHEYFIEDEYEAGLALQGWEVKSLRAGKANIGDSYVILKDGEASCSAPTLRLWPWLPPTMSATRRAPVSCCSTSVSWTRCTAALTAKVTPSSPCRCTGRTPGAK